MGFSDRIDAILIAADCTERHEGAHKRGSSGRGEAAMTAVHTKPLSAANKSFTPDARFDKERHRFSALLDNSGKDHRMKRTERYGRGLAITTKRTV